MAFGSLFMHLALLLVLGFVLGNVHQIDGTVTCPFVDLCIKNASKIAEITPDISQCCPLCYCDRMCVDFNDCCPDVNVTSLPVTHMAPSECLTSVFPTEYSNENASFLESRKYFQKRNCSELFMSNSSISDRYEIKEKCEGKVAFENFDDIVMVSNLHQHGDVFTNKYCAMCNGVSEIVRWNIKIHSCRVNLLSEKADLGPLLEVILGHCHVESIPPPTLQTVERIRCSEPAHNNTCNQVHVYNMAVFGEDINSTCNNATRDYEFVSYDEDINEVYGIYKCYVCVNSADQIPEELCMDNTVKDDLDLTIILDEFDLISGWMPPSIPNQNGDTSTRVIPGDSPIASGTLSPVDPTSSASNRSKNSDPRCSFDELYLKEVDLCVKITCPSYTVLVNKKCIPIANSMIGIPIQVRMLFRFNTLSAMRGIPFGKTFENYVKSLAETVGLLDVGMFLINVELYIDETSREHQCVAVIFYPVTSLEHPVSLITSKVAGFLDKTIHWNMTVSEKEYFLQGKMDFRTTYDFLNGSYSVGVANLFILKPTPTRGPILDGLYICPHVIFDVDQYCFLRRMLSETVCPYQITEFNVTSEVEKGFYVVSPNSVGICIDTLQQQLDGITSKKKETAFTGTFVNEGLLNAQTNKSMQYFNACVSNFCDPKTVFVLLSFLFSLL